MAVSDFCCKQFHFVDLCLSNGSGGVATSDFNTSKGSSFGLLNVVGASNFGLSAVTEQVIIKHSILSNFWVLELKRFF